MSLVVLAMLGITLQLFDWFKDAWHPYAVLAVALLLVLVSFGFEHQRTLLLQEEDARRAVIEEFMLIKLREELVFATGDESYRVNIMTMKYTWYQRQIALFLTYGGDAYSDDERKLTWNENEGCCGTAFKKRAQVYFDGANRATDHSKTQEQIDATDGILSVLATPLVSVNSRDHYPVAVLNIDSRNVADVSGVNHPSIHKLLANWASVIERLF